MLHLERNSQGEHFGEVLPMHDFLHVYGDTAFALFSTLFDDCPASKFSEHMLAFDFAGAIFSRPSQGGSKSLVGFSATSFLPDPFVVDGIPCYIVTNGPTVIVPTGWGARIFFKQLACFIADYLPSLPCDARVYFALLSEGVKSYLFLANNFCTFFPRMDRPIPEFEDKLLQQVGSYLGETEWRPDSGTVEYEAGEGKLRHEIVELIERSMPAHLADIYAYFCTLNPGHDRGDYLVCLGYCDRDYFAKTLQTILGVEHPKSRL